MIRPLSSFTPAEQRAILALIRCHEAPVVPVTPQRRPLRVRTLPERPEKP